MNDGLFICIVAAAVALLTVGLWLCSAFWLRLRSKARRLVSIVLPQFIFGMFLMLDGAPFNGVIFAVFLLPLVALQAFVVVVLEARDFGLET
jgi:hypothetical protein